MKRNFTLLEMLIVAAVIAILAGLLFPALSAARAGGRKTACMNLLKQYSLACSAYVADYGGYYPDVRHYLEPESAFVRYFGNGGVMPEKIARCPGDASTEALRKVPRWRTAENTFLKVSIGGSASNLVSAWRRADLPYMEKYPVSKRALWLDYQAEEAVSDSDFMDSPPVLAGAKTGYSTMNNFVFRHSGGTSNIAYMDGHVGDMRILVKTVDEGHRFAGAVSNFANFMHYPFGPRPDNIAAGRGTVAESPHVSYH